VCGLGAVRSPGKQPRGRPLAGRLRRRPSARWPASPAALRSLVGFAGGLPVAEAGGAVSRHAGGAGPGSWRAAALPGL